MQQQDESQVRMSCFEFCRGPEQNPVATILDALGSIIFDPDHEGRKNLRLLHFRYGSSSSQWPPDLLQELHMTCVVAFARLWRLMFVFFLCYPWKLARIFDDMSTPEQVRECLDAFLALPKGSSFLDPGLGRKLREIVNSSADLLDNKTLFLMLKTMFLRVVVTSTFVERVFRDLTNWTSRPNQDIGAIASKYTNSRFGSLVAMWREAKGYAPCEASGLPPG